jgi:hypothetical protein
MLPSIIHYILYYILYGLGRAAKDLGPHEQRATDEGSIGKVVRCEQCAFEYIYRVSRRSQGRGFSREAAARRAGNNLTILLSRACEPVPCPMCGWLQRDMVRRARQLRFHGLLTSSMVLFLTAVILPVALGFVAFTGLPTICLGPAAVILGFVALVAGFRVYADYSATATAICVLVVPGVVTAAAAVLLVLRFVLPWFYNPNATDVEGRIALGKSRAVSKELYDSGSIVLPTD